MGVRGMWWEGGLDDLSPLRELGGPAGPAGESRAKDPDPTQASPAPRGLKTQPQAVQTSIGVRRVR